MTRKGTDKSLCNQMFYILYKDYSILENLQVKMSLQVRYFRGHVRGVKKHSVVIQVDLRW